MQWISDCYSEWKKDREAKRLAAEAERKEKNRLEIEEAEKKAKERDDELVAKYGHWRYPAQGNFEKFYRLIYDSDNPYIRFYSDEQHVIKDMIKNASYYENSKPRQWYSDELGRYIAKRFLVRGIMRQVQIIKQIKAAFDVNRDLFYDFDMTIGKDKLTFYEFLTKKWDYKYTDWRPHTFLFLIQFNYNEQFEDSLVNKLTKDEFLDRFNQIIFGKMVPLFHIIGITRSSYIDKHYYDWDSYCNMNPKDKSNFDTDDIPEFVRHELGFTAFYEALDKNLPKTLIPIKNAICSGVNVHVIDQMFIVHRTSNPPVYNEPPPFEEIKQAPPPSYDLFDAVKPTQEPSAPTE